nr:zinc finger, CCHC-type [Tanacetum cinerariifolium]
MLLSGKEAINNEIDSIIGNNTWMLVDLLPGYKPLGCKWIFKRKLKVDRTIEKFKARLLIAMASIHNLIIHHMDVKTTFLNGELDEEVDLTKEFLSSRFFIKDMREAGVILVLEGYTDASWINNSEDNSSTSGWVFLLGGAAGKEAEWLRNLILEILLWSKPITPISIRYDSATTLAKDYSQMYNGKSRHLGVRYSMIRELITNGVISIAFVRSQQNLAEFTSCYIGKGL